MSRIFPSLVAALWLLPAVALADTTTPQDSCARPVATAAESSAPDYPRINQVLTAQDRALRLQELPGLIHSLESQPSAETLATAEHLRLALSQAQALDGDHDAAVKTLTALPLASPLAPQGLQQLAEIELLRQQPDAALRWLQQLAAHFPDEPVAVEGLLRAAEIHPDNALALLQEATRHADAQLEKAHYWKRRSQQPDFLDEADTRQLPDSLWRLARNTLTDPAYVHADTAQAQAREQMQCLLSRQQARTDLLRRNPLLLADIANTVATLEKQLALAKSTLATRENDFLKVAAALKACQSPQEDCALLRRKRDMAGRELTGWRNRIAVLERKTDFLAQEKNALPSRWQQDNRDAQALADLLAENRGASHQVMTTLLSQGIDEALARLEELAAQAHYQLALAQDPRLNRQKAAAGAADQESISQKY